MKFPRYVENHKIPWFQPPPTSGESVPDSPGTTHRNFGHWKPRRGFPYLCWRDEGMSQWKSMKMARCSRSNTMSWESFEVNWSFFAEEMELKCSHAGKSSSSHWHVLAPWSCHGCSSLGTAGEKVVVARNPCHITWAAEPRFAPNSPIRRVGVLHWGTPESSKSWMTILKLKPNPPF